MDSTGMGDCSPASDNVPLLFFPGKVVYLQRGEDQVITPHLLEDGTHPVLRTLPVSSKNVDHHKLTLVQRCLYEAWEAVRERDEEHVASVL